ncbi:MAG TPA: phosphate/phosphite/phosphonate ABC transporter substrate-binding protein [Gammaproteobacteria bacterium]|nr:phosphate/phosphite/phosphonate ABC transporter substrate-binding protein [Gammaproteobacteria bacterium]
MQIQLRCGVRISLLTLMFILSSSTAVNAESEAIRFGIMSVASPSRVYLKWQAFVAYVSRELGQPIEIVVPYGFEKMGKAVANGEVDFFYINSHVFYLLKKDKKARAILQMQNIDGKVTSKSKIFVRSDSGINNVQQLKGKKIAFVSPVGAGGYLAPRAYLYNQGIETKKDSREVFTKNMTTSIHKVLLGDVAAGAMCGLNFRLMKKKIDTGELKTIAISGEYPENVIAVRTPIDTEQVKRFQKVILAMPDSVSGRQILKNMYSMKIKRFVAYDESIEKITQKLLEQGQF